ncbi:MAG: DUF362 domain-containing protein [candidate division WOR-3 bacterium]
MNRRDFLKKLFSIAVIAGVSSTFKGKSLFAEERKEEVFPDLVAVKGGSPEKMFDEGIKALGGMRRFVKKGEIVVVKPNIAWIAKPESAANTNPGLVKRIIEHCFWAGARKVYVFDHTCDDSFTTYKISGIESVAKEAGATIAYANKESYYQEVVIPEAYILKKVKVHELILESDVFINVPILKHHSSAKMTSAFKNLMGVVWDRFYYHRTDLDRCIAEFPLYRKPNLTVVDAYNVLKNGPRFRSMEDVLKKEIQLLGVDIVALDVASSKILGENPENIKYIIYGEKLGLGKTNLEELNIKRITL